MKYRLSVYSAGIAFVMIIIVSLFCINLSFYFFWREEFSISNLFCGIFNIVVALPFLKDRLDDMEDDEELKQFFQAFNEFKNDGQKYPAGTIITFEELIQKQTINKEELKPITLSSQCKDNMHTYKGCQKD